MIVVLSISICFVDVVWGINLRFSFDLRIFCFLFYFLCIKFLRGLNSIFICLCSYFLNFIRVDLLLYLFMCLYYFILGLCVVL